MREIPIDSRKAIKTLNLINPIPAGHESREIPIDSRKAIKTDKHRPLVHTAGLDVRFL